MTAVARLRALARELDERPTLQDGGLALLFAAVAAVIGIVLVAPGVPDAPSDLVIVVWAAAFMAPLAVRRRWPLTVAVAMTAHFLVFWQTGKDNDVAAWLGLGAGFYAAAAYGRRPHARWTAGACFAGATTWLTASVVREQQLGMVELFAVALFIAVPCTLGWSLGAMIRRLRLLRAEVEERNAELEVERQARARRAILDERVRIARELHDVVAHHVSLMTVQAAAARRLLDRRPDEARASLAAVEDAGRSAIAELQQLVGVLRRRDEGNDLAPQPGLDQLPTLAAHMAQAGLAVTLNLDGVDAGVPAGVALSAYRIVQEALTNTLKHAGATRAEVTLTYAEGRVEVEVTDDGRGPARSPALGGSPSGKGLVGMRERVAVYGGTLAAGPRPGGGYRVHALLRGNGA